MVANCQNSYSLNSENTNTTMEKKDYTEIKLTVSQDKVLKQMLDFIKHPIDRVFILKGYAGTGKTTLMRYLIEELKLQERHFRLLASTGRAAKILSNLSGQENMQASTILSLIHI